MNLLFSTPKGLILYTIYLHITPSLTLFFTFKHKTRCWSKLSYVFQTVIRVWVLKVWTKLFRFALARWWKRHLTIEHYWRTGVHGELKIVEVMSFPSENCSQDLAPADSISVWYLHFRNGSNTHRVRSGLAHAERVSYASYKYRIEILYVTSCSTRPSGGRSIECMYWWRDDFDHNRSLAWVYIIMYIDSLRIYGKTGWKIRFVSDEERQSP